MNTKEFVTDDINKGKKKRSRTRAGKPVTPAHDIAEGTCDEQAKPQMAKGANYMGNVALSTFKQLSEAVPVGVEPQKFPDYARMRTEGTSGVAAFHQNLHQSSTALSGVLARLQTVRGNTVDAHLDEHTPGAFSHQASVSLVDGDFASEAGSYMGMKDHPSGYAYRPADHIARNSATPRNPNYPSSESAASRNPISCKEMSSLEIVKTYQRRMI